MPVYGTGQAPNHREVGKPLAMALEITRADACRARLEGEAETRK